MNELAQLRVPGLPDALGGGDNPAKDFGLSATGNLIAGIANAMLIVAAIAAFIYFILGGIQWVLSSGDKAALESARNKVTHAILGLVIVAAAWAVWTLVGAFLGFNTESLPFPTVTGS